MRTISFICAQLGPTPPSDDAPSPSCTPGGLCWAQPIDAIIILICDELEGEVSTNSADEPDPALQNDQQGGDDRSSPVTYRFSLETLRRSEAHDERALICALDFQLALSTLLPESNFITMNSCSQLLFYRALRHRLPLYYLGGTPTPDGRKFGEKVYLEGPGTPGASFSQLCDTLDIPFSAALDAHLRKPDHKDPLTCLCEAGAIFVAALWLQVLLHEYPHDPDRVTRAWEASAPGSRPIQNMPISCRWSHRISQRGGENI